MKDTPIYQGSYQTAGMYATRIWIVLLSGTLFSKTTKDTDIAHAFTYFIYPLKYIKVPVDRIGTTLAISIKFVPEFTDNAKQIILAKKLRANHLSK
jgi:energy-coupling factor transport system permease protein